MIQLKSTTRIPSSGRRDMAPPCETSPSVLDDPGRAETLLLRARDSELLQDFSIMLAEHRRPPRLWRGGREGDELMRIFEPSRDRMVDLDERVACREMSMVRGLRNCINRADRQTAPLTFLNQVRHVVAR